MGHIQEKTDQYGVVIAYRAVIANPNKLTSSGTPKRETRQFAVTRQPGDRSGIGMTPAQAKKAAENWLHDARQTFVDGRELSVKTKISLADAADYWRNAIEVEGESGRGKLRDATLDYYDYVLRCYVHHSPTGVLDIGVLRLSEIKPPVLKTWVHGLINEVGRGVAKRALTTLRAVLRHAVSEGWIYTNPAAEIKLGAERHEDGSIAIVLERKHVVALLTTASALAERGWVGTEPITGPERKTAANRRKSWARWYPFFYLAFFSGARTGELLAARSYDFDSDACTFRIDRTVTKGKKGDPPQVGDPKTVRGRRTIAIDPTCIGLVEARVNKLGLKPADYVFGTGKNKVDNLSNVRRAWVSLVEIANGQLPEEVAPLILPEGGPITSPYHSRHYHASELLRSGASLDEVSERLGHRDTVITQRHYARLLGDRTQVSRRVSDRFSQALGELTV